MGGLEIGMRVGRGCGQEEVSVGVQPYARTDVQYVRQ